MSTYRDQITDEEREQCDTCRDLECDADEHPDPEVRERARELLIQHLRDQH